MYRGNTRPGIGGLDYSFTCSTMPFGSGSHICFLLLQWAQLCYSITSRGWLRKNDCLGRGECVPVRLFGGTPVTCLGQCVGRWCHAGSWGRERVSPPQYLSVTPLSEQGEGGQLIWDMSRRIREPTFCSTWLRNSWEGPVASLWGLGQRPIYPLGNLLCHMSGKLAQCDRCGFNMNAP